MELCFCSLSQSLGVVGVAGGLEDRGGFVCIMCGKWRACSSENVGFEGVMGPLSRARGKSSTGFCTDAASILVSTISSARTGVRSCSSSVEGARTGSGGSGGGDGGSGILVGSASSRSGGSGGSTDLFSAASFARDARSLSSRLSLRLPVEFMTGSSSREGDCVRGG